MGVVSSNRVLIVSHDIVGPKLAGPGIRYRELARVLAREFEVTLAVPGEATPGDAPYNVWPYAPGQWHSLAPVAGRADVVVACGDTLAQFPPLAGLGCPLVIDGYDPHTLETLALWAAEDSDVQARRHEERLSVLREQCQAGDFFICASERQRDWWLGLLQHHGRINPQTYAADPSLRSLIDVVPFGLPAEPPCATRPVLRSLWPILGPEDRLVLWGGGLWEWLDPLTAIRAMRRLSGRHPPTGPIRLVFPGTRHPNRSMPDMPLRRRALALADELGLTGQTVFFGDWVAYEDWPAVLLEADVGLSLHPNTVEARLAYRSRVMDYVWAGLPMVVTRGDAAADLVAQYDLGLVVDYEDDAAVADGILRLLEAGGRRDQFDAARRELTWGRVAEPLAAFCRHPQRAADRPGRMVHLRATGAQTMSGATRPSISVIVLIWNGAAYVDGCLTALCAQEYPEFEVIVVDNGSTDGTPDIVAQRFPTVKLLRNARNLGFAAGNNVGLRAARGELLVLLNHDTQVQPGWLAALASTFDDPAIGVAGCKLLYPDGTIQHAGGCLRWPRGEAEHLGRHVPDDGRFDRMADVEYVTGAALAIRRAAMDQIGPLDEDFGRIYYEDADWCYRARRAGYRVVYQPLATVIHYESVTKDALQYEQHLALCQGRIRFLLKHRALDKLLWEFRPAELAWIQQLQPGPELLAAREAYLRTLLALPGIAAYRRSPTTEANALIELLTDLRTATTGGPQLSVSGPATAPTAAAGITRRERLRELEQSHILVEQPFQSRVPVLGGLIAAVRSLWNSVSTKWYVKALVEQQNAFNALVVRYLLEQLDGLPQPPTGAQLHADDWAEAVRESTALAEHLARLGMSSTRRAPFDSGPGDDDPSRRQDRWADGAGGEGQ